jgi:hypothetical protein
MDRLAYHRSIFLDDRISQAAGQSVRLPAEALTVCAPRSPSARWIFHFAHCGSTLLSRTLDDPTLNLVLREPLALRQLAFASDRNRLAMILAMLSKRYCADLPTIVKANVPVNFLLPDIIALDPEAPAIFLHCSLGDYLPAILRSEDNRRWLRGVTTELAVQLGDLSSLSDAECCAALWLAQMRAFAVAISRMRNARSLDAETFLGRPRSVAKAAARHLGVPMSDAAIDTRVDGPLFATYSKSPGLAFNNVARLIRRARTLRSLAGELAQAKNRVEAATGEAAAAAAMLDEVRLVA